MTTEATAQQPKPAGKGPAIAPLVCEDIMARNAMGEEKYGEVLRAFNGRDPLVDVYQELLDAAQYIRQELEERRARAAAVGAAVLSTELADFWAAVSEYTRACGGAPEAAGPSERRLAAVGGILLAVEAMVAVRASALPAAPIKETSIP